MDKTQDLITDSQIDAAFEGADFGNTGLSKRELLSISLLKCACGFETGNTLKCICEGLGVVTPDWQLSQRGQRYLYAAFSRKF